jgi:hypothetical protein
MTLMWLASASWAALVDQQLRVGDRVDLLDAGIGGGEDFFVENTNVTYRARHAYVQLYEEPSHSLVASGHTDANGLITFEDVDTLKDYSLVRWSGHSINDRPFRVIDADDLSMSAQSADFSPYLVATTIDVVFDAAVSGQEWINVAAIGSWVIHRRQAAFPTYTDNEAVYTIKLDDPDNCPVSSAKNAIYCYPDLAVYIDPTTDDAALKSVIAHELAHELQHWALVPTPSSDPQDWMYSSDYDADSDANGCNDQGSGHNFNSFEYQSAAITEGMAHYVAAVAFNNTDQADCRFIPNSFVTWDPGLAPTGEEFSCEGWDPVLEEGDDGGAEWIYYDVPGHNHFDWDPPTDPIGLPPYVECADNTTTSNRGIELDWLRFFWDLDHAEGLETSDVIGAWTAAEPAGGTLVDPWNANDDGDANDAPRVRLNAGFDGLGFDTEWDNKAVYNGVMR